MIQKDKNHKDAFLWLASNWYKHYSYTAKDGKIFTVGEIANIASKNLTVVILTQNRSFEHAFVNKLFANIDTAALAAKTLCERYNRALNNAEFIEREERKYASY